jgi:tRNA (mo5U34)-methyltransferase
MDVGRQQARIDSIRWYHEFDFGNGLRARSHNAAVGLHRAIWRFIEEQLETVALEDRTVLDLGCWDGYWSFYAERRGARHVLATDDCSQNWSDGQGLLLARELLGSAIEVNQRVSVYDLASLGRKFDVILFLGVYYHLFDPFQALAQIRHCCHQGTLVLIEGNEAIGLPPGTAMHDLDNRTSRFTPTLGALRHLLRAAYFTMQSVTPMAMAPFGRLGWRWRLRMAWEALRGSRAGMSALAQRLYAARRVFLKCVPFVGENEVHVNRPPFGLDVYDSRFSDSRAGSDCPGSCSRALVS